MIGVRRRNGTRIGAAPLVLALIAACVLPQASLAQANWPLPADQARGDVAALCRFVEHDYAYLDTRKTDWTRACDAARDGIVASVTRDAFVGVLERLVGELYDHHAHLGTNTPQSPRLVPSQTDLVAQWKDGRAMVVAVRSGSPAERAGLRPGMAIVAIDGEDVAVAVGRVAPRHLRAPDPVADAWALQVALAGRHARTTMRLTVSQDGQVREIEFAPAFPPREARVFHRRIGSVGYVRIGNALGDPALVADFDHALTELDGVRALVLDLRDTPSGGTSSVARGLMGRFVGKTTPYQRHELVSEFRDNGIRRVWVEEVAPRGPRFRAPVVVLVGRWTGSMGEGIAIGLDAAIGAPVLGEPMARLEGALGEIALPHSGIVVRVPAEKLAHVNGTPREAFVPRAVADRGAPGADASLDAAVALAARLGGSRTLSPP